jgi:MoxR-like ATPase
MEGTYQLPEAQIDRFLFKSLVRYPTEAELDAILDLTTGTPAAEPRQILGAESILRLQQIVREVPIASHVRRVVARLALQTQPDRPESPQEVRRFLRFGLSPRGAQALVLAAKGHALLNHRYNVSFDDLRAVLLPVMRHRVQLNYEGEAEGLAIDALLIKTFEAEVGRA